MSRPTFANATALLALVVAMSGTAYAVSLPRDSVESRHIVDDSVKGKDIREGTVRASDLADGVIPDDLHIEVEFETTTRPLNPGEPVLLTAMCPPNGHAISGGVRGDDETPNLVAVTASNPIPRRPTPTGQPGSVLYGWQGSFVNNDTGTTDISPTVWVICTEGLQ